MQVLAATLRPCGLMPTAIANVECGPFYWVVSLGSDIVTIEKGGRSRSRNKGGGARGGGVWGSEKNSFTGGPRAIMQYCKKVYWMCLTINNQFMGT